MNSPFPQRKSIRLHGYDYSSEGLYFVTICTQNRQCLFGEIINSEIVLNDAGKMVDYTWYDLPNHNPNIQLDTWCIMPNHVHGIIIINNTDVGANSKFAQNEDLKSLNRSDFEAAPTTKTHGLPEIIRQFKTFSTRRINELQQTQGRKIWQRNYYEHIIRNQQSYIHITDYIMNNPINWQSDDYFTH